MNEAIVTRQLVKTYGRFKALNNLTLAVPPHAILGLVGRNGAGKTTWMMSVVDFVRLDSGEINVLGQGPFDAAKHSGRVGILPQDSELPLEESPRKLLIRYGRLQGLSVAEAARSADQLLEVLNLKNKAKASIKSLSHGMRKRVMVAQAFLGHPEVVLLDEPLSGLDPEEAERMRNYIRAQRGKQTIVISSHQLEDIEKLCTHVAFVADGHVERIETLAALTSDSGRIAYRLRRPPSDLSTLMTLMADTQVAWHEEEDSLIVDFDTSILPETINDRFLPVLLPCGIISVTTGRTLAEAYLKR